MTQSNDVAAWFHSLRNEFSSKKTTFFSEGCLPSWANYKTHFLPLNWIAVAYQLLGAVAASLRRVCHSLASILAAGVWDDSLSRATPSVVFCFVLFWFFLHYWLHHLLLPQLVFTSVYASKSFCVYGCMLGCFQMRFLAQSALETNFPLSEPLKPVNVWHGIQKKLLDVPAVDTSLISVVSFFFPTEKRWCHRAVLREPHPEHRHSAHAVENQQVHIRLSEHRGGLRGGGLSRGKPR